MIQLKKDQCIFKSKDGDIYLAIHVDDGIIIGNDKTKISKLLNKLREEFEITVKKEPKSYLGIDITKSDKGISISQENYAKEVLKRYDMQNSKPMKTPIAPEDYKTEEDKHSERHSNLKYREVVGSLLYLSCKTRADLSFAVNYESRSMENPQKQDFVNIKHTLRYLNNTTNMSINYYSENKAENVLELIAYCDSDYAGDARVRDKTNIQEIRRKSTSGFVIMFCGGPISWCSRRQTVVAQSSTEAELIAACECAKELKYLKELLNELTNMKVNATMYMDNQSTIKLIKAGSIKSSKHIEVKYFFIKDEYYKGLFDLKYVSSEDNVSDVFTKPLLSSKFEKCVAKLY